MIRNDLEKNCCNNNYKLILMDYDMPRKNGAEACREILQLKAEQNYEVYKCARKKFEKMLQLIPNRSRLSSESSNKLTLDFPFPNVSYKHNH